MAGRPAFPALLDTVCIVLREWCSAGVMSVSLPTVRPCPMRVHLPRVHHCCDMYCSVLPLVLLPHACITVPLCVLPSQLVMEEEQNNPEFSFLFNLDSPEHVYYRCDCLS